MLVMSQTRYIPVVVNTMVLQRKDGEYYYVHRSLYDRCVVLRDKYYNMLPSLYALLGKQDGHPRVCDTFMETAPEPLDILGPFLSLVKDADVLGTMEDMCGALSVMSSSVDFCKMLKCQKEVRAAVSFNLCIREEYRLEWDRFFFITPTYEDVYAPKPDVRTEGTRMAQVGGDDPDTFYIEDEGLEGFEDFMSLMEGADGGDEEDEEAEKSEEVKPAGPPSGFDLLKGVK